MPVSRARAATDAWVSDTNPDQPGNSQGDRLRIQDGTPTKVAVWHGKIPAPVLRGAVINVAELRFTTPGSSGDSYDVDVKRISEKWVESQITYNTLPSTAGVTRSVTVTETTADTEWAVDVQSIVQAVVNGADYFGFQLSTTDTTERKLYSFNAAEHQPYLYVEWSDVPDAPTELSPSGGAAVTIGTPTFLFNFHDPVGSDMAALRLQIKATNSGWTDDKDTGGFASPDFDTETDSPGGLPATVPQYDSSTGSFAGISAAAVKFWTCQVQNAAGNWSKWSDPRQFTRVTRGTLTVSSPTGGTVDDHTPTFIWSTTGTQTGWQITVWDDSDPGDPIFDTDRKSGSTGSFTLPKGVVTDEGVTYRFRVRIWEDLSRTSTPGDLIHTELVDTFMFAEGAPTRPSAVTVAQSSNGKPHAELAVTIASAPDFFVVARNGVILDEYDPTDLDVSGTTYTIVDRTAAPNRDYEYKVRSKVAGHVGPARVATPDPFRYTVRQLWLTDWDNPGSNRLIPVDFALGDCTFEMPETSGTFQPVDGNHVVTVVQGMAGLCGTIVGKILPHPALAAAASVDDMVWAKLHPTNKWRMTLGGQNLPVKISRVYIGPTMHSDPDARAVSFYFAAQSGPNR